MTNVIAHRGASAAAPENTIEAFHLARDLGSDWVELDARRTRDGAVVVHHDAHLADGRAIVELDRREIPIEVPDLAAALDACAGMGVNIEIKNQPGEVDFDEGDRVAELVVEEVGRRGDRSRFLVSSFNRPTIDRIREGDAALPTAFLHHIHEGTLEEMLTGVAAGGHGFVHPWDGFADERYMQIAAELGLAVNVWTVDDPIRMGQLVDLGVAGICTNVPDLARRIVDGDTAG